MRRAPRITFDATMGEGTARTDGEYFDNPTGTAADALLAFRVRSLRHGAMAGGVNVGVQAGGSYAAPCDPEPVGCLPDFPIFEMAGALVGWQTRNGTVRVMAGGAYVQADWQGWSVAWQARVDGALPLTRHLAVVGSLRGTMIPNDPQGHGFRLFALGIGVRIQ